MTACLRRDDRHWMPPVKNCRRPNSTQIRHAWLNIGDRWNGLRPKMPIISSTLFSFPTRTYSQFKDVFRGSRKVIE
jgi:hypothetical protein